VVARLLVDRPAPLAVRPRELDLELAFDASNCRVQRELLSHRDCPLSADSQRRLGPILGEFWWWVRACVRHRVPLPSLGVAVADEAALDARGRRQQQRLQDDRTRQWWLAGLGPHLWDGVRAEPDRLAPTWRAYAERVLAYERARCALVTATVWPCLPEAVVWQVLQYEPDECTLAGSLPPLPLSLAGGPVGQRLD
jgi:hypothetical protein